MYPHAKIKTLIINQVVNVPAYLYLGVWISLQILFGTIYLSVQSGVGRFAHIGGFLSGLILMWVYKKRLTAEFKNGIIVEISQKSEGVKGLQIRVRRVE